MRARRLAALVGVLALVPTAAAVAAPNPPLRPVASFFTNSGVNELRCMGSYNRAVALGLALFSVKRTVGPEQASMDMLLPIRGASQAGWLNFCVTLRRP
jgi:hypothetical protein